MPHVFGDLFVCSQVRCRRVLPLLRAALAAGDFHLVRRLLHFFWALFAEKHQVRSDSRRGKTQRHLSPQAACASSNEDVLERAQKLQPRNHQQSRNRQKNGRRMHQNLSELQSFLWRPLQEEIRLNITGTQNTGDGVEESSLIDLWLCRVPEGLPPVDRLTAARVYREVEVAVTFAASSLLRQHKWLQLFDFATTLALDLPAWLRNRSSDLLELSCEPNKEIGKQKSVSADIWIVTSTAETADVHGYAKGGKTADTDVSIRLPQMLPRTFTAAVSSFAEQLCVGRAAIPLHLRKPTEHNRRPLEEQRSQQYFLAEHKPQPAPFGSAVLSATFTQSGTSPSSLFPRLCSMGNRQEQATTEIARYLARVLLLSGYPAYTLALASAVRDQKAIAQIIKWYPELRRHLSLAGYLHGTANLSGC